MVYELCRACGICSSCEWPRCTDSPVTSNQFSRFSMITSVYSWLGYVCVCACRSHTRGRIHPKTKPSILACYNVVVCSCSFLFFLNCNCNPKSKGISASFVLFYCAGLGFSFGFVAILRVIMVLVAISQQRGCAGGKHQH